MGLREIFTELLENGDSCMAQSGRRGRGETKLDSDRGTLIGEVTEFAKDR